ncbi:MAG: trypsin-like peptidase domain-containing protein [Candidatus Bathyarchaeota archaeon]|nr:MAG: trypsin-like peptidase domain-containing protein [Candidatus Bathyarchaeota archaeon]
METTYEQPRPSRKWTSLIVAVLVISLVVGAFSGYLTCFFATSGEIDELQNQVTNLQGQLAQVQSSQRSNNQNLIVTTVSNASVSQLYAQVADSVVVIRGMISYNDFFGRVYYSQVQGSGFVYTFAGQNVIITNSHVIEGATGITVTFVNGNAYSATVLGSDPYAELAVLSTDAPEEEFVPLEITSSSNLQVGDPVIVVGTPYGLAGSMSTGYVSALGRTLTAETTGRYVIANVIQTTAALNPGNSGGPVLNYNGEVIGIATAIFANSEGLGFAIPSNTILREIEALVNEGYYNDHPWLGASGVDMNYEIAQEMEVDVTYGWLIANVSNGGPSDQAGLHGGTQQVIVADENVVVGGDIIIAINGIRITGIDDMSSYLSEYTLPGDVVELTVIRNNETISIDLELGTRPTTANL